LLVKVKKVVLFVKWQIFLDTQKVGLEAAILLRKRNSILSIFICTENKRITTTTETTKSLSIFLGLVVECPVF